MKRFPSFRLLTASIRCTGMLAVFLCSRMMLADPVPPDLMTYQGFLTDGNGNPLDSITPANHDVIFRIYNDQSSTNTDALIWSETQTVTVLNGNFSVILGAGNAGADNRHGALSAAFKDPGTSPNITRYLDITVTTASGVVNIKPRL